MAQASPRLTARATSPETDPSALLQYLGLTDIEASVLLPLFRRDRSPSEIADLMSLSVRRASQTLASLLRRGLVKRIPGRAIRYGLVAPGATLSSLLEKERQRLNSFESTLHRLIDSYRAEHGGELPSREYVEVIAGMDAIREQFEALQGGARSEILGCTKLPLLVTPFSEGDPANPGEEAALTKGVRNRWLYDREVMELPGFMEHIRHFARLGEESRVTAALPAKLFIIDREITLIHATERSEDQVEVVGVLMRHPELVQTFHALFELIWEGAAPLAVSQVMQTGPDEDTDLVDALASGMKDRAIARQLGVSERTVRRRVSELMQRMGVASRFQAGMEIGRKLSAD